MNRLHTILLCLLAAGSLHAQQQLLALGANQNPPGVSWQHLQSPHFRIIFPREIAVDAQAIARLLEQNHYAVGASLGVRPGPLPLVLHTRTTISNGFVSLAPRRSEWYNTPPQVGLTGPLPWYNLLAIHEFRHVVQFDRLNHGLNRLLYYGLGETGWLAGAGFSVPTWFFEGDATVMETALTPGGRGRQPEFLMPIRTLLLSGRHYSYYKMFLGTCREWPANPYEYGFLLTTWLRRQHGAQLLPDLLKSTANLSLLPFRFSWSLRRRTGRGIMASHRAMLAELDSLYRTNRKTQAGPPVQRWNRDNHGFWTAFQAPRWSGEGSAVVCKYGMSDQAALVRIQPDGREEQLLHPQGMDESPVSVAGNLLVWAERLPDPRWGYQDSRAIQSVDLGSGRRRTIAANNRYFAPALAPDGLTIAVIACERDNSCQLVLLDARSGAEIRRFPNPARDFLMTPAWSPDGHFLALSRVTAAGRGLCLIELKVGTITDLVPPGPYTLATPVFCGRHILFSSNDGDTEQIFAAEIRGRGLARVTSRPFGAFYPAPSPDGRRLLFNDYDAGGLHLAEMALDTTQWLALEQLPEMENEWFAPVAAQEEIARSIPAVTPAAAAGSASSAAAPNLATQVAAAPTLAAPTPAPQVAAAPPEWPVTSYSAWRDLPRIHSWELRADAVARTLGASLFAHNLLRTLQASAGYDYDRDQKRGAASLNFTWARWYPLLEAGIVYGERATSFSRADAGLQRCSWSEKSLQGGLRLPLTFSRRGYTTRLTLQSGLRLTWIGSISDTRAFGRWENRQGWFRSAGYGVEFLRYRKSRADILPVRGQALQLGYDHSPWQSDYHGERFYLSGTLYFPGLARRHGFALQADYEHQRAENYRYDSAIRHPRGYPERFHEKISRVAVDYALPLLYPEKNIWALLYIQRLKGRLFTDYGRGTDSGLTTSYRSSGLELSADVNLLAQPVIFELGLRASWRWHEGSWYTEALLGLPL